MFRAYVVLYQPVHETATYTMPLHVSSICVLHQEVKIALHSLWYHHTYRWPYRAQVERRPHVLETCRGMK